MTSNTSLERTVGHCGRTVLALDCVLAGAESASWSAAQLGRYAAQDAGTQRLLSTHQGALQAVIKRKETP